LRGGAQFDTIFFDLPPSFSQTHEHLSTTAKIQVLVRNRRDEAVPGLTPDDFIVTEHGGRDSVSAVEGLTSSSANGPMPDHKRNDPRMSATDVLLIITPMSAIGRNDALSGSIRFLSRHDSEKWQIALLDDEGSYVPFGQNAEQLRAFLQKRTTRVSAPQLIGGPWLRRAGHAIEELGAMPGRHALVVISDFGSNVSDRLARIPKLLRVWPSMFADSALRAQAVMYTIQSSGPGVAVPFGTAAGNQYSGSDQDVATRLMNETVYLGSIQSDFLKGANETGGMVALDVEDAFKQIAADNAGYYLVTFQPDPDEPDGAWRPVSVTMRSPDLRVRGPRYYLAPIGTNTEEIPAAMKDALQSEAGIVGLQIEAKAWLFPQGEIHTGALVADLSWTAKDSAPGSDSRLQIFAELLNDTSDEPVVSWYEETKWSANGDQPAGFHWQRELPIYPGAYTLKVIGMDKASGKLGRTSYSFLAHSLGGTALRFGEIVLSDKCLSADELNASRRNLFDPLFWNGCELAPASEVGFNSNERPVVLVRLYPPDQQFAKLITKQWRAYAIVDDVAGRALPLSITSAAVRGLVASGNLNLSEMGLKPGAHRLTVVFEFPTDRGGRRLIPLRTEFSIKP
jgi:VWFA-related protein